MMPSPFEGGPWRPKETLVAGLPVLRLGQARTGKHFTQRVCPHLRVLRARGVKEAACGCSYCTRTEPNNPSKPLPPSSPPSLPPSLLLAGLEPCRPRTPADIKNPPSQCTVLMAPPGPSVLAAIRNADLFLFLSALSPLLPKHQQQMTTPAPTIPTIPEPEAKEARAEWRVFIPVATKLSKGALGDVFDGPYDKREGDGMEGRSDM